MYTTSCIDLICAAAPEQNATNKKNIKKRFNSKLLPPPSSALLLSASLLCSAVREIAINFYPFYTRYLQLLTISTI